MLWHAVFEKWTMVEKIKKIPWWGWVAGVVFFVLQYGIYRLGAFLSEVIGTVSYAFDIKIPPIDDLFPVVPAFSFIYIICSYILWICAPAVASLTSRRNFVNYLAGLSLAIIIGFLIFIFLPTYMDRVAEGLMDYADKPGFFNGFLAWIYSADGSDKAFNLFPSFHCMLSTYCYLGIRKQPEISKGFKTYTVVMAVLICLSTLLTKQHYIVDVAGGIGLAIMCYAIMNRIDPGRKYANEPAR